MNIPWDRHKDNGEHAHEDNQRGMRLSFSFPKFSFSLNLYLILALWPLLWIIGIEQFVPPLFILWEFLSLLYQRRGRIAFNFPSLFAVLLAFWSLVPIGWVEPGRLQSFLKESVTLWSQALILLLFLNRIQSRHQWSRIEKGLLLFALYQVISSLVYILGIWRNPISPFLELVLPESWMSSSVFLQIISNRKLGVPAWDTPFFSFRVNGLSLQAADLATTCLILIPFVYYAARNSVLLKTLLLPGLVLTLVFTATRAAYIGFLAGSMLFVALYFFHLHKGKNKILFLALFSLGAFLLVLELLAVANGVQTTLMGLFTEVRSGSLMLRMNLFEQTMQMFWDHPFAGWGYVRQVGELSEKTPLGTHLGFINVLFRHGIIGLTLYLGLWASIWQIVIRQLGTHLPKERLLFWTLITGALLSVNIRELANLWWWDQSTTMVTWCIWGLILTAPRIFNRGDEQMPPQVYGGDEK